MKIDQILSRQIVFRKSAARHVCGVVVVVTAASLSGCVTKPATGPAAGTAPTIVTAPAVVTMAPIPNPDAGKRRRVEHEPPTSLPASKHTPSHPPAPHPAVATIPPNPQQAARLRAAGLEQLNRGSINRAVDLLRQAAQLDPANKLIQHDLERALRIGQAVRARH